LNVVDSRRKKKRNEKRGCECRNRPIRSLGQKRGVGVGRGDTREGRE